MTFKLDWKTTVLTVVLMPLLVALGFWQLSRADEKRQIASSWQLKRAATPVPLDTQIQAYDDERLAWLRLRMHGEYIQGQNYLLDNRMRGGRFGYEVLTPFRLAEGETVVLVNRGWIAADPARRSLPEIPRVNAAVDIATTVYVPPGDPYLLREQQLLPGWPKVVQAIDIPLMAQGLELSLFSRSVRIDPDAPGALQAHWSVVNVSPEKHTGYAVQWFAMALVLTILYLVRSIQRAPPEKGHET